MKTDEQIIGFLKGKKTYIIAALLFLVSLVNLFTGSQNIIQFLNDPNLILLLGALGLGSVRAAISKVS